MLGFAGVHVRRLGSFEQVLVAGKANFACSENSRGGAASMTMIGDLQPSGDEPARRHDWSDPAGPEFLRWELTWS